MLRKPLLLSGLLATVLSSGTGCAFINVTVRPPPLLEAKAASNAGPPVVVVVPFTDARPQKGRCGMVKNGYNMDTASVLCAEDPAMYLAEHLAASLRASGFTVHTRAASDTPVALRIEGTLLQFFVEPNIGVVTITPEADIHVKLVVTSPSGLEAERSFYVKEEEPALVAIEPVFQSAADKATRRLTEDMSRAIRALFERYPELRTPSVAAAPHP